MKRIERNKRKSIFKRKGFKQALSLIMILFMCLVLLPVRPIEAAGETFNSNRIYLDVNGMNKNSSCNFENFDNVKIVGLNAGAWTPSVPTGRETINGIEYFYWDISDWTKTDKTFAILYKDWNTANGNDWARTNAVTTFDNAKGKAFYWDGSENEYVNEKHVYKLIEGVRIVSKAGSPLKFVDMTETLGEITAVFATDESFSDKIDVPKENGVFTVPPDNAAGNAYKYVMFKSGDKNITKAYEVTSSVTDGTDININSGNSVLYYGVTEKSDGTKYSYWGQENTDESNINGKKLYLEKSLFNSTKETYIQIGTNPKERLSADSGDSATLSYTINNTATQKTIITIITSDNTKYHFFWSDLSKDLVTISNNAAVVSGTYSKTYTVYFDATLSKLPYYIEDVGAGKDNKGIPKIGTTTIYYHAWGNGAEENGTMEVVPTTTIGNNTWKDLYKVNLQRKQPNIIFYSDTVDWGNSTLNSSRTINLTIPQNLSSPCFYADSSDDVIYNSTSRGGYWDEVYTVRDPEKEGGSSNSVVDIATGNFENERDTNAKYVTTTFYDFYTDYELNGKNRDNYYDVSIASHRIYQPFRQFNQALSSYYETNKAVNPIYWGNFQNYKGSKFSGIADTLNLYGYNKITGYPDTKQSQTYSKFFFNNNSMWGYGPNIAKYDANDVTGGVALGSNANATLGLVGNELDSAGNLQIEVGNSGVVKAPYFDKDFLEGNNSKNTKLGKVYENVEFPFQSVALKSKSDTSAKGKVKYWVFDSRGYVNDGDSNQSVPNILEMKKDRTSNQYYLQRRITNNDDDGKVHGQTLGDKGSFPATADENFFPFNTKAQSGNGAKLNYGFAMKMQFDFRLTEDGMVTTDENGADGNPEKVPIEFNFSGDDDVWIFIDGKLALDIGGGHGRVEGRLNFKDKTFWISGTKNNTSTGGTALGTGKFSMTGGNTSTHTLTMFYMERGLWESNMHVTFNFPDDNTFQVEKQIDTTDVNEIFQDTFTNNKDKLFTFNIQNKVTHYGKKDANTNGNTDVESVVFNDTLENGKLSKGSNDNTFYHVNNFSSHSNVALWNAKLDDKDFQYVNKRYGIISPATGDTISVPDGDRKLLQFDCYLQNNMNLPMRYFSIELEDSSGNKITGILDSSKTKGISEVKINQWQTVTIELEKLKDITAYNNFHFDSVKYFKFNCCYSKNIYLDNIKFVPEEKVSAVVGFKTQQDQIPDYGSASGSELKNATNAVFELKNKDNTSSYEKVDANGNFMLGDRSVATFSNQFRRGSYISVSEEEVNPEVFKTKWTIFENDQPVERYGSSGKLTNPAPIPSLVDRDDLVINNADGTRNIQIDDGRTEETDGNSSGVGYDYDGTRPRGKSIVFRSYKSPDDETSNTKLKALFVNTVRTGSIAIEKSKAKDSPDLKGEYTFRVTFTNVAGMSMESDEIVKEYTLNVGETKVITGIPAGTQYYIEEIEATDKAAKVEDIKVKESNKGNDEYTINSENKTVTGVVKADDEEGATATTYTFSNTTRQKISIDLNKVWKDENGNINNSDSSLPEFITVQLQRRIKDSGNKFEPVTIDGKNYVEVKPSYDSEGNTQWKYTFSNLDKFAKIENGTESDEYEYKVVEVEVKAGVATIPEDNMITLNGKNYIITLGDITKDIEDETKYNTTITNKIKLCSIEITKADLESKNTITDSEAKFKIQKLKDDKEYSNDNVDSITSADYDGDSEEKSTKDGVVKFENLEAGTYLIEEVQAPSGYIKLGKSFIIEVPCEYTAGKIVDGVEAVEDGTKTDIKLTVYNPKGAILPISGLKGIQLYLLIGVLTMLLSAGVYTVVKVRKSKKIS